MRGGGLIRLMSTHARLFAQKSFKVIENGQRVQFGMWWAKLAQGDEVRIGCIIPWHPYHRHYRAQQPLTNDGWRCISSTGSSSYVVRVFLYSM